MLSQTQQPCRPSTVANDVLLAVAPQAIAAASCAVLNLDSTLADASADPAVNAEEPIGLASINLNMVGASADGTAYTTVDAAQIMGLASMLLHTDSTAGGADESYTATRACYCRLGPSRPAKLACNGQQFDSCRSEHC